MISFFLRTIGYLILMAIAFVPAGVVHFFFKNDVLGEPKESLIFTIPYVDYEVVYAKLNMTAYSEAYIFTLGYVMIIWVAVGWVRMNRKAI